MRFHLCRPSESNEGRRTIRFIKGDGPFVRRGGLNEERTRLFFVSAAPTHEDLSIDRVKGSAPPTLKG